MDDMEDLGARVLAARRRKGMNQFGLAKVTGLNPSHIQRIEDGMVSKPSYQTLEKIAAALDVSVAWLVNGTEPPAMPSPPEDPGYEIVDLLQGLSLSEREELRAILSALVRLPRKQRVAIRRLVEQLGD